MSAKLTSLVTAHYILLARSFVFILGCIAVWWGIIGFSVFWQQSSTGRIANRIIAGDPFKVEILARQLPIIDSIESSVYCRPAALQSAAIIRLRMVEAATSENDREHLTSLGNVIRSSLSCAPADPFLWLVLYWVESTKNGFKPEYLKYLKMSYQLGPNEGWVVLKRNPVVFADFARLPADLATDAINEFVALINNRFYQQAVEIFSGFTSSAREAILPHLTTLPLQNREAFARAVYNRGLDIKILDIEPPESKPPWH